MNTPKEVNVSMDSKQPEVRMSVLVTMLPLVGIENKKRLKILPYGFEQQSLVHALLPGQPVLHI